MSNKRLSFPDNFMRIFGFERLETDKPTTEEITKMSEASLGKIWNTPEEDEAWKDLQEEKKNEMSKP